MPLLEHCPIIDTEEFGKILLLSDTHIGYEVELILKGLRVPRQTRRLLEHYINIAMRENVNSIAILGDIKHEIPIALETYKDVEYFLREISNYFEYIILTQGNHDGGIDKIVDKIGRKNILLYDSRGVCITMKDGKRALLLHGNAKPKIEDLINSDFLIMGHTHPAITIRDIIGYTVREPVIIRVELDKRDIVAKMYRREIKTSNITIEDSKIVLIILPCANMLITGTDITRTLLQKHPSSKTILTYFELWNKDDKIEVYLQDFTYLGTLRELIDLEKIIETKERVDWNLL